MAEIPDKVSADLRSHTLVTVLKGMFSAGAVSCDGCGINRFEGEERAICFGSFYSHALSKRGTGSICSEGMLCGRQGSSHLTGSENSVVFHSCS